MSFQIYIDFFWSNLSECSVRAGYRTARYAQDMRDLFESLGLHDVTLVGWSIGARTSLSYLELFGGYRLKGVVFVDDCPHVSEHAPPPEEGAEETDETPEVRNLLLAHCSHEQG